MKSETNNLSSGYRKDNKSIQEKSELHVITNNVAPRNVEDCHDLVVGNARNYGSADCSYRLWHSDTIDPDKPNSILVHGAVIPIPGMLHKIDRPNGLRLLFIELGSFLHSDYNHNIWSFEYADEPVGELGYVNYGCLNTYGDRLINAIKKVKSESRNDTVNIIAHSMGGLIARYAAQNMGDGKVNKIITLDTGHLGFELAGLADELLVDHLPEYTKRPIDCSEDTKPKSDFVTALTKGFSSANYELVSLAAGEGLGGLIPYELEKLLGINSEALFRGIPVVDWSSSSMGQVDDDGRHTHVNYDIKFDIVENTNHLTIAVIIYRHQTAYQQIISNLY